MPPTPRIAAAAIAIQIRFRIKHLSNTKKCSQGKHRAFPSRRIIITMYRSRGFKLRFRLFLSLWRLSILVGSRFSTSARLLIVVRKGFASKLLEVSLEEWDERHDRVSSVSIVRLYHGIEFKRMKRTSFRILLQCRT